MDTSAHRRADGGRVARDRRLFARYHDGDDAAVDRDTMVQRFLPLARQLALQYTRPPEPFEDVYQVACIALLKAIDRYDLARQRAFTSYAVPTIVGEIKRYYRDRTWMIHVPRDLAELALRVQQAEAEITSREGRPARTAEVARTLEITEDQVINAQRAWRARRPLSIEAPCPADDGDPTATGLDHRHGSVDSGFETVEERAFVGSLLRCLTAREARALCLYHFGDLTQQEIGDRLGISQMQVSRVLARSRSRLQEIHRGLTAHTGGELDTAA